MKCRVGDAVLISSKVRPEHNGKVAKVVEPSPLFPAAWLLEPQMFFGGLFLAHWADESLIPLRGGPGRDEMLLVADKPGKVTS